MPNFTRFAWEDNPTILTFAAMHATLGFYAYPVTVLEPVE